MGLTSNNPHISSLILSQRCRIHAAPSAAGLMSHRRKSRPCGRLQVKFDDDDDDNNWMLSPSASPFEVLGVDPNSCSPAQLKAAFRSRVKEFHPDICKNIKDADTLIKRVIQAYEMLSRRQQSETLQSASTDPFDEPECEAYHIFVNKTECIGKGCPYSCIKRAPHVFSFSIEDGTAQVICQGDKDDYLVQLAVGQCPRKCIHYVTPAQRAILDDIVKRVMSMPYDMGEVYMLDSLISKAKFENNRFQKPKRKNVSSTEYVDWME